MCGGGWNSVVLTLLPEGGGAGWRVKTSFSYFHLIKLASLASSQLPTGGAVPPRGVPSREPPPSGQIKLKHGSHGSFLLWKLTKSTKRSDRDAASAELREEEEELGDITPRRHHTGDTKNKEAEEPEAFLHTSSEWNAAQLTPRWTFHFASLSE